MAATSTYREHLTLFVNGKRHSVDASASAKPFTTLLSGSLCCTPGSCFWFKTALTRCSCPTGYTSVERTGGCTQLHLHSLLR